MNPSFLSLALAGCCVVLAAGPAQATASTHNGFAPSHEGQLAGPVTLSLPSCANTGTVIQVGVSYPTANPTVVKVTLTQPTSGAPYLLEQKINKRKYDGASGGTSHNFYIDPFIQIGGTATVKAVVQGVGSASGSFQIPCP
jgi:hypothetical protein